MALRPLLLTLAQGINQSRGLTGDGALDAVTQEVDELAAQALGLDAATAKRLVHGPDADTSITEFLASFDDPLAVEFALRSLAARQDAFNRRVGEAAMNRQERVNASWVNRYRLVLGRLPLELDLRLIQSARRHSKEMTDLSYFSHESPTAENKSHTLRMRRAGYPQGYAENIASGNASGEATFWQWFKSPGHHRNMVRPEATALGVGQWADTWTQNTGRGKRVMHLEPAQQAEVMQVEGDVLAPR